VDDDRMTLRETARCYFVLMGAYDIARSRLRRAISHGERLAQLWNALPTEYLCTPKAKVDLQGYGVLIATNVGGVPEELPLLLGEQLYQLRSALDACIYQATIYGTMQDPPPNEGRLEFPITHDATEWPNLAKRRLSALPKPIQDAIERVQPYNNLSLSSEETVKSVNRSLGILHDLARKDRHRRLHVVGSCSLGLNPQFLLPVGTALEWLEILPASVLENGSVLAKFRLKGYTSGQQISVNPQLKTNFGCTEPPVPCHPTDTFDRRLVEMINAVGSVIAAFELHY